MSARRRYVWRRPARPAAQDLLLERIHDLTVAGSRAAVEALSPDFADPDVRAKRRERMDRIRAVMAKADPQREIPRNDELWYFEEREDVGEWFGRHGWNVTVTTTPELMASYDRAPAEEVRDTTPHNLFVSAQRTDMWRRSM